MHDASMSRAWQRGSMHATAPYCADNKPVQDGRGGGNAADPERKRHSLMSSASHASLPSFFLFLPHPTSHGTPLPCPIFPTPHSILHPTRGRICIHSRKALPSCVSDNSIFKKKFQGTSLRPSRPLFTVAPALYRGRFQVGISMPYTQLGLTFRSRNRLPRLSLYSPSLRP